MGICKLTNKSGKYVKSHIIPKALTRPSKPGNKFVQPDSRSSKKRYIKRADSWYDKTIVIREGEDYLSDLDDHAIEELRSLGLLWSSPKLRKRASPSIHELTVVEFRNPAKIRKYFLSLLWRAAVSSLPEFYDIELQPSKLERLRKIIVGEEEDDLSFFPVALVQLSSKGPAHNFIPLKQKIGPDEKEIYRFYMDGLIAHLYISDPKLAVVMNPIPYDHPVFLGHEQTVVCQVETSESFQISNLEKHLNEYEAHK
ncbi:hypothetical protein FM037_16390 [Shewanella psychropiezotolerans]|uniref:DUF4238 domain-containing protein n=1 Tax=Shewanella psychropiezotolerans TaxID=2593655 RepID=A0ABX5WZH0_9GAMM|nr:hypothetical protein [Shewanella psychropiezotolerans]QDO84494.1 hypothetical protein FM037_16390 [Shewanella psychropiezotolerans]